MGYGIYHDQVLNGTLLQHIGLNAPYQITCSVTGVNIANPVPGGNCTAAASANAGNVRLFRPIGRHRTCSTGRSTFSARSDEGYARDCRLLRIEGTNLIGAFELNDLAPGYAISRVRRDVR
jgi:hypothetical protein